MAFMVLLLAVLLGITVWAFFHTNPAGVPRKPLLAFNAIVLLVSAPAGLAVGYWLYTAAAAAKANHAGMAGYLGVMAAGTVFLLLVAVGGMARNFFLFPLARRTGAADRA